MIKAEEYAKLVVRLVETRGAIKELRLYLEKLGTPETTKSKAGLHDLGSERTEYLLKCAENARRRLEELQGNAAEIWNELGFHGPGAF